jgi:hypothetical protein
VARSGGVSDLEHFYPGDDEWHRFAALFRGQAALHAGGEELARRLGDEELADVIFGSVGADAPRWLARSVPALSGLSPLTCLDSPRTVRRLRTLLLRFPR